MFGLPVETVLLVFGFPVFWILYTIVFVYISRDWYHEEDEGDRKS